MTDIKVGDLVRRHCRGCNYHRNHCCADIPEEFTVIHLEESPRGRTIAWCDDPTLTATGFCPTNQLTLVEQAVVVGNEIRLIRADPP